MKILYLSISYVPSRSASSVHAMKMCAAFARAGHDVELVTKGTRRRQEDGVDDAFRFYGVDERFRITSVPRPAARGGGLVFLWGVWRLLRRRQGVHLVYSRDLTAAWIAARCGHTVIFEAHGLPSRAEKWVAHRLQQTSRLRRLVFISNALQNLWREANLLNPAVDNLVAHDAADPLPAVTATSKARSGSLRVAYVGHLYPGRGVELILEMARQLPAMEFHLVGGEPRDLEAWRARSVPTNARFHGFVAPRELPALYRRFDVLLMPYQRSVGVRSGRSDTARWMSPMKMFEYLASGRAILSSDLPVLREVLEDDVNALLLDPEDPCGWIEALRRLEQEPEVLERLGHRAREDFHRCHTWSARGTRVLDGLAP